MKKTVKNKAAQGCKKISSFFTNKQRECSLTSKSPLNLKPTIVDVINLESEEEESESLLHFKPKIGKNKRKIEAQDAGESPPSKAAKGSESSALPTYSRGLTKINSSGTLHISPACIAPSTSGETPIKNNSRLSVKTPEKLLSTAALCQLYSPTKCLDISFHQLCPPFQKRQEQTPEKVMPGLVTKSSNKRSSGKGSSPDTTPKTNKRTPKKLFEKSPNNLNEFNVEVLRNFVKITPTKKEVTENETQRTSLDIQVQNEKTPIKDVVPSTSYFSPKSNVRTKLNFNTCTASSEIQNNSTSNSIKNYSTVIDKSVECNSAKFSEKENYDINNASFIFDENSWGQDFIDQFDYTLDLSKSHHCKIIVVNQHATETIINVKSTQTNEQAICTLQGFWMHLKLCIGDIVQIVATKSGDSWLVNNEAGFLIFEPDFLVSTTSVVNSVFCKRRTIFQERFRGFDPTNKYMIVGSMVHSLLQDALKDKLYQPEDLKKRAQEILHRKEWIKQIYESGESLTFITEEFLNYIPKIEDFLITYVCNNMEKSNTKTYRKDNWKGIIAGVEDIEENIWCPSLGVKGKIDVTVKNGVLMMPLEVKTGRASVSLEHRGQVLLYIMMMNKLGYQVSSGLLLYLKEGVLKEIPASAQEQRDIIILRNELAYFLSRSPKVVKNIQNIVLEPTEVPEPIDHPCCRKCPYNSICFAYSKYSNEDVSTKKSLKQVHNDLGNYLTSVHIDYFMHWSSLLSLEMSERSVSKSLRDIYTMSPEERKNKGRCLIDLMLNKVEKELNGTFLHTFQQNQSAGQFNFLLSGLLENNYVVVSVKNRPAIASGFITDISMQSVIVSLDRNLEDKYQNERFFIDSYDSTGFLNYNLASLALILDTTERANQLRSIIVDRQPATFQKKLPRFIADKAKPILKRLNRIQQRAVLKAIAANEYFLIKGMPGTGKTATIVALVQLLVEMNQTVLITSHTHSAVDNVCRRLITFGIKFMRLGNETKMDPVLKRYSESNYIKDCNTSDDFESVYNSVSVIAVTCLGSGHPVLLKRTMDMCIVDESTQVLQCSVFKPLFAAKKFILIGDPDQLPAVVRNRTAIELGMNESIFERLDSEESRISLNLNYRMNGPITALANALTYNGELEIGADRIAKAYMSIPKFPDLVTSYTDEKWILNVLDTKLENAVQFVDTGPTWNLSKTVSWALIENHNEESENPENQKCLNIFEAAIIYRLVEALTIKGGVLPDQIGVIATYRSQVALLAKILNTFNIDVNTVDQFQGKDKHVIIYSCSKSNDISKKWVENKFDITADKRRLNVAITRAKHKLIIVGDLETLQNYSNFKKIRDHLGRNVIKLLDCDDFNWDTTLNL